MPINGSDSIKYSSSHIASSPRSSGRNTTRVPIFPLTPSSAMAVLSQTRSSTWIFNLKALLLSAAALLLSLPLLQHLFSSMLLQMWSSLLSFLSPPYLYLLLNAIIISIAVTSRFHNQRPNKLPQTTPLKNQVAIHPDHRVPPDYDAVVLKSPAHGSSDFQNPVAYETVVLKSPAEIRSEAYGSALVDNPAEIRPELGVPPTHRTVAAENPAAIRPDCRVSECEVPNDKEEEELVISRADWDRKGKDPPEDSLPKEKPLVSARFGNRKSLKANPEGKRALRVTKPKLRHGTLETTWKAITEGRPMPLARHQKKSDTWDTHARSDSQDPAPIIKKSETMNDRITASSSPSLGSGKKESSLSKDELNRRVEAFIRKFNEEMRLQRQQSLENSMEMVNRGTH